MIRGGMLQKRTQGALVYYASPLLEAAGVPHGFSTRLGGVSPAPFEALNLGNPSGCATVDRDEHIEENYRRLLAAVGCAGRILQRVHQVHGAAVAVIGAEGRLDPATQADALVGNDRSVVLSIRIADCVPVLLSAARGTAVAAVHAGWRGVIAGVIPAAVRALSALAGEPVKDLVAAIGPCIGPEAFEVGPEVLEAFEQRFGSAAPIRRREDGKGTVDLQAAAHRQLRDSGVLEERIDGHDRCTYRDAGEFYSHRREHGVTGRLAAVIGVRG
jgi:YfiH family protein